MKIVLVTWRDASGNLLQYCREGDDVDMITVLQSVGFLISEDENQILLATKWDEKTRRFRCIIGIPRESVIKKKILR